MAQEVTADKRTKTVSIFVNNREVQLDGKDHTGAEIKAAAGVPPDFQLFAENGNTLELVEDDDRIKVHPKQRFRAVSGQDVS